MCYRLERKGKFVAFVQLQKSLDLVRIPMVKSPKRNACNLSIKNRIDVRESNKSFVEVVVQSECSSGIEPTSVR